MNVPMTMKHLGLAGILLFLLAIILPFSAQAQIGTRHQFDFKKFNLGFLMGLNINHYNLKEQVDVVERGVLLREIEKVPKPGLSFGMIANYNLHDQIALRSVMTISLEQRDFLFHFANKEGLDSTQVRKIESAYLNVPVMFQLKSKYWAPTRMYVLAGGQFGWNMQSSKKVRDDKNLLKITNYDLGLVFGFGWNLYGDRIKLSPEIRYSVGLMDIFVPEYTTHAGAISRLSSQVLTFNINFE
jgi:hypothetical protein